jgi:ATP-dependent helicase HrpA
VIDSGFARISRYSPRSKVQRLPIEKIAQASAEQRKGRCGRQSDGICIRLYSEEEYAQRPPFTEPEIRRTNLAAVVLQMKALRLGAIDDFPFLEPPDKRQISDAQRLLAELGATDRHGGLTPTGRQLSQLPLDPSFGRMLLAAAEFNCLDEALIIISALSIQDPRERPLEAREKADAEHARFRDEQSDFIEYLTLWAFLETQSQKLSKNQFRHLCRQGFLSYTRIREWRDIHRQLASQMREMGYRRNHTPADYETLHTALSSGLLSHVAQKTGPGEYTGARGIKLKIFPGSSQFSHQPKWIMAAELLETSQLFARTVARIDPEWLLKPAAHLLKSEYFEPAWDKEQQRVNANERITLYGLPLVPCRSVNYAGVQPDDARKLFIQHALVENELKGRAPFLRHNRKLLESIRREERKIRRPDILDEQSVFDFYDQILPAQVCDGPSFESWRKRAERDTPDLLFLQREQIIRHEPDTTQAYPDQLEINGIRLPVDYRFKPGSEADGMTVTVPLQLLNQLDTDAFERLVPGLLEEKITAMLRALPKSLRRHFVPVPDTARRCINELLSASGPLPQALSACLLRLTGVEVPPDAWCKVELPQHLRPRFRITAADGKTLACDRDYQTLREQFAEQVENSFAGTAGEALQREGIEDWDFGDLPAVVEVEQQGYTLRAYPALVDCHHSVAIRCFDTENKAQMEMHKGLRRLFMLGLRKDLRYLSRNLPERDALCLAYSKIGRCEDLVEDILKRVTETACMSTGDDIRSAGAFQAALGKGRSQLVGLTNDLCALLLDIMDRQHRLRTQLSGKLSPQWLVAVADIRQQLDYLVYPGFVLQTPHERLRYYPRYLDAIERRLERLQHNPQKDHQLAAQFDPWWRDYLELAQAYADQENKPPALLQYRWLLEEYRVSLFAQDLKTSEPVSDKRLHALRDELRRAA